MTAIDEPGVELVVGAVFATRPPASRPSVPVGDYTRPAMSEADWQAQVVGYAKSRGWRHYHTHDSRRSPGGFPDLVLIRAADKRLVFVELKREKGRLSPDQVVWVGELEATSEDPDGDRFEVYVWRPRDWPDVVRLLA